MLLKQESNSDDPFEAKKTLKGTKEEQSTQKRALRTWPNS